MRDQGTALPETGPPGTRDQAAPCGEYPASRPVDPGRAIDRLTFTGAGVRRDHQPARWLTASMVLLAVLAAAAAVVSFSAQYRMVHAAKGTPAVAALEAAIPDVAALIFATLGIALALHGRRAIRARTLNVAAVGTSVTMNVLAAGRGWRDLAIWVMPPIAYALASDTAIGVARAWTLARQRALDEALAGDEATPLALVGGLLLWLLRLALAPVSTLAGFRAWVVEECPVAPRRRARLPTRKAAEDYGRDQEAAIRSNTYVDPRAGQLTLTEWVNIWFPAQDLELNTLSTYKYTIEVHILPAFGAWSLRALEQQPEAIALWEKQILARGYTRRTARDSRSTLVTILADAIPRHIRSNPAARRRGKGRKGQRRIERAEKAEKTWATPFEALLFAERCSVLSGTDTDFVMLIAAAYTGMRWSEAIGLLPANVHQRTVDIEWKLYELDGRFYRGRPKDGSIRAADIPPFLGELLTWHLGAIADGTCACGNPEPPWCPGDEYVFLGPRNGHFRRSNYAARMVRPAADGRYPARQLRHAEAPWPVLVDMSGPWPGAPLPPWPPAQPGLPFTPPAGRGIVRLTAKEGSGRCPTCKRTVLLRRDGMLIGHKTGGLLCPGSGQEPGEPVPVASWLPLRPGLTPHGLRHGHQTWLDDLGVRYVLQSERMGHEVPGMRGVYSHITLGMRADLVAGLQELWEASLNERVRISARSPVPVLDMLLAGFR